MADGVEDRLRELAGRMAWMERRMEAVEHYLSGSARPAGRAVAPPPPPPPPVATPQGVVPPPATVVPPPLPGAARVEEKREALARVFAQTAPITPPVISAPPVSRPKRGEATLEAMIGRNWTSWVGAIVVVLGVLFFLKYAWDQGWLAFSPAVRVGAAIAAGIAFELAGWWTGRRSMRVLAGTLTGAGVAIVMAAFFAGHTMFDEPVFPAKVALAGVCAAAAVGIWRGLRMNVMSLAIVALLGAYLAPAILRSGRDESVMLMMYLGALGAVGWTLAYWKPRWAGLRWFVWTCTLLWVGVWIVWFGMRGEHRPLGIITVTYFLAGFMGEMFLTLHRAFRIRDPQDEGAVPVFAANLETSLATFSMLTTGAALGAYYALLRGATFAGGGLFHPDALTGIALGLAALHGMLAVATPARLFGRSSVLQAAALVTIAVPLALGQVAITLAWLVMAAAMAGLAWGRKNDTARVWAVVLLGLAVARLFTLDLLDPRLHRVMFALGSQEVTGWLIVAWAGVLVAHGMGWLFEAADSVGDFTKDLGKGVSIAGTVIFVVAAALAWHDVGLTLLWIAGAAVLVGLAPLAKRLGYGEQGAGVLLLAGVKWFVWDGLRPALGRWGQPVVTVWPVLNPTALAGLLLIVLLVVGRRWVREEMRRAMLVAAGAVAFALANFETLRLVDYSSASFADFATAKVVALSVLWGVTGLAAVVVGFAKGLRELRYAALGLLGVTLVKILFVDLAQVRPVYRILSFLATGVLLLCVSFVYHRHETGRAE
jgi:uncharacterized membrane protein